MTRVVLLVGATGLFGGHLARRLAQRSDIDLVLAGRTPSRLAAFAARWGGRPLSFDRDRPDEVGHALAETRPFAVIDAAGPFQHYGDAPYRFAQQVIAAGAHYLDIADAPGFVAGFSALDAPARDAGVVALSGASSTPALSSAAADRLRGGLLQLESVETTIIPGNRTDRGRSVVAAILSQVGQPFEIRRGGRPERAYGWDDTRRVGLRAGLVQIPPRRAALVETPETRLFPEHYGARTASFRAGLELGLFHRALTVASHAVRRGVVSDLAALSSTLHRIARWFRGFGSDTGGMQVSIVGRNADGGWEHRHWDLIAPDGVGPQIPTLPAEILLNRIEQGQLDTGARPAVGVLDLGDFAEAFAERGIQTEIHQRPLEPLFRQVLGAEFDRLPAPVRTLHNHQGVSHHTGKASVRGPTGITGRIAALIGGFPRAAREIDVSVTIDGLGEHETWTRRFGFKVFRSHLSKSPDGKAVERFGPLWFTLDLKCEGGKLAYPVRSARLFRVVPLPRWLVPVSETFEYTDELGRFVFDVKLRFSWGAEIAQYRGYLEPELR